MANAPQRRGALVRQAPQSRWRRNRTSSIGRGSHLRADADRPFDVLLLDWRMPGLDGVETARRIRADSSLKSVPAIIIITAFGREEVRGEAELAGVNGFLIKPVNQSTLVNALAEIFAPGHCAHELIAALASGCSAPILLCGGKFPEREYSLIRNLENDLLFGRPPMRVLEFSHDPTRQCRVS